MTSQPSLTAQILHEGLPLHPPENSAHFDVFDTGAAEHQQGQTLLGQLERARVASITLEQEHADLLRRLRQLADAWPKHSAERLMLEAAIAPPAEPADQEPADLGHTFRIRIRERGAFGHVDGRPAQDADYWTELPAEVDVRGWSLCEALARAAALPLGVWFGEPLPAPEPLLDLHSERGESVDGDSR